MVNGFLNGYAPTQTGGLLTPGLGTLSLLVNIRDMIVSAITPVAAPATTTAVTSTKTTAAKVVTLDIAHQREAAATADASSATTATAATGGTSGRRQERRKRQNYGVDASRRQDGSVD
jgi:hypothetical protein